MGSLNCDPILLLDQEPSEINFFHNTQKQGYTPPESRRLKNMQLEKIYLFTHLQHLDRLAQFTFKVGLDEKLYKKETRPDRDTCSYIPYLLGEVCRFFHGPC